MWPMVIGAGIVVGLLAWLSGDAEAAPRPAQGATPPPPSPPKRRNEGAPPVRATQGAPHKRAPQGPPPSPAARPPQGAPPVSGARGKEGAPPSGAPDVEKEGAPPSPGDYEVPFGGVRQVTLPPPPPGTEMPFGGARTSVSPTVTQLPPVPLPPAGGQSLDPAGRLPLYQLGEPFTVTLPEVDENWTGKSGPPYVAHGTVIEVRWSSPSSVPRYALESERKTGTYIYTVWLAEYKAPKNLWTGSEGMVAEVLAKGAFKRATVGAFLTPKQTLDPAGRLPLYALGTAFAIGLPAVDLEAWQGQSGPPYITHATVDELHWSPQGIVAVNALESEADAGTYIYSLALREFKLPKNIWTGSEGKIKAALASGLFKSKTFAVGASMTVDQAVDAFDKFLRVNALRFLPFAGKEGLFGGSVVIVVPRVEKMVVPINKQMRELTAAQLFALAKLVAEKFTSAYDYPVDVELSEV